MNFASKNKKIGVRNIAVIMAVIVSYSALADWNGSGTFERIYDWTDDQAAGINPSASRFDEEDDSFAAGINNALAKDGQNAATGDIDFNGNALVLDVDADTKIASASDDRLDITIGNTVTARFGHDSTNSNAVFLFDAANTTAQANTSLGRVHVKSSNALTIPTGTTTTAATLWLAEPNLTATGTLTNSATLYIAGAATEATNDYALWVDSGDVQLDSTATVGGLLTLTTGASFGNETLSNYNEGTASLSLSPASGAFSSTTRADYGIVYTEVGQIVHFQAELNLTNFTQGGASGVLSLSGLPYAADKDSALYIGFADGFDSGDLPAYAYIVDGASVITLKDANGADITVDDLGSDQMGADNDYLLISGSYVKE